MGILYEETAQSAAMAALCSYFPERSIDKLIYQLCVWRMAWRGKSDASTLFEQKIPEGGNLDRISQFFCIDEENFNPGDFHIW